MSKPLTLADLTAERRAEILSRAADTHEPRFLRRLARALAVELPVLANVSGLPAWRIERTLNGRRRPDVETLAAIRAALGVSDRDLAAARLAAVERRSL